MLKNNFTIEQLKEKSENICSKITSTEQFYFARIILLYSSLPDEVDVSPLMEICVNMGKKVLLPKVVGDDLELRFYNGTNSLVSGAFGILEPIGEVFSNYDELDLAIVPGMSFDSDGNRLGRGKGYYDRLLSRLNNAFKMGVCFNFQFLNAIPFESHDVKMDSVMF